MKTCDYRADFSHPESKLHFHMYNTDFNEVHDHNYWEFFIIVSGETEHWCEGKQQILTPGMGCLVHPRDKHKFMNCSKNYQQINVCITDDCFKEMLDIIDTELYGAIFHINHPIFYDIDEATLNEFSKNIHLAQTTNNKDNAKYANYIKLLWLDIVKLIYRNASQTDTGYPEWLNNFIEEMRKPENLIMPVSEMYKLTYFSYRHLSRLFHQHTGETLCNFVQTQKINYAAMLLRTTDHGILHVSSLCGYDSLSYFIKTFKKHLKMTPNEYRKSFSFSAG